MSNMFYCAMQGSFCLFADEREKKRYLDLVLTACERRRWTVFAFCVLDEAAHFLVEASGERELRAEMERSADGFLHSGGRRGDACEEESLHASSLGMVEKPEELPERCRQIHRMPLEAGYVSRLPDYWWSSYRTYIGGYQWPAVNCRRLLQLFSGDGKTAERMLRRFHSEPYTQAGFAEFRAAWGSGEAEEKAPARRRGRPAGSGKKITDVKMKNRGRIPGI